MYQSLLCLIADDLQEARITTGIRANEENVALRSMSKVFIQHVCPHKHCILCPWLEATENGTWQHTRISCFVGLGSFNVYHGPAVKPTDILPIKLCHILVRSARHGECKDLLVFQHLSALYDLFVYI